VALRIEPHKMNKEKPGCGGEALLIGKYGGASTKAIEGRLEGLDYITVFTFLLPPRD